MLCCSLPCGRREWRVFRHNWTSLIGFAYYRNRRCDPELASSNCKRNQVSYPGAFTFRPAAYVCIWASDNDLIISILGSKLIHVNKIGPWIPCMPITTALLGSVGFPSWEAPGRVHSFTISPSRNLRSGPTSVEIKGNQQQWLILIGVESQSSLQQSKTEKRLWRGKFKFYCLYRIQNVLTSNLECQRR